MGKRYLKGDLVRMLPDHRTLQARAYRAHVALLAEQYTLDSAFKRDAAASVALARVLRDAAVKVLIEAQGQRAAGRGRKPSAREVERLAKRQGLQAGDYERALDRLEKLCGGPSVRASRDVAAMIAAGGWPEPVRRGADDDGHKED